MRYSELYLEEIRSEEPWGDVLNTDSGLWSDMCAYDGELELAMHHLPTEQELMDMEADRDTGKLENLERRERRTALRH